ncbi:MAG: DUF1194 domain-containing protein [Pseudomonadota bacterium]
MPRKLRYSLDMNSARPNSLRRLPHRLATKTLILGASVLLMLGALLPGASSTSAQGSFCTLALVLAVDVSGSVDSEEYALQMGGLADAFRTEDIIAAIDTGGASGIYVTVAQWSGAGRHEQIIPWRWLNDRSSVAAFANEIDIQQRAFRIYSTGIGEALAFAWSLFAGEPNGCARRVVDVSGDGPSNEGREPGLVRSLMVAEGITINGLAILESEPGLRTYYRGNVAGGAGSFVVPADTFEDYPRAIKRKLLREILPAITLNSAPTSLTPPASHAVR